MDSATIALIGALTIGITGTDQEISDYLTEKTPVFGSTENAQEWSDAGPPLSCAIANVSAVMTDDPAITLFGQHVGTTTGNTLVKEAKRITNILRPDGSGRMAFPSGHAYKASICAEHSRNNLARIGYSEYDWVGEALAIMTAYARVEGKRHWPTDALVGYAAGVYMGRLTESGLNIILSRDEVYLSKTWGFE